MTWSEKTQNHFINLKFTNLKITKSHFQQTSPPSYPNILLVEQIWPYAVSDNTRNKIGLSYTLTSASPWPRSFTFLISSWPRSCKRGVCLWPVIHGDVVSLSCSLISDLTHDLKKNRDSYLYLRFNVRAVVLPLLQHCFILIDTYRHGWSK